jgi:hypothetical protein
LQKSRKKFQKGHVALFRSKFDYTKFSISTKISAKGQHCTSSTIALKKQKQTSRKLSAQLFIQVFCVLRMEASKLAFKSVKK